MADGTEAVVHDAQRVLQRLTFANVYCLKFNAERERTEAADSFRVRVDPSYMVADGRVDYLFVATCEPLDESGERVGLIEVSVVATFDAAPDLNVHEIDSGTVEYLGGEVALYAAYPYLREAVQAHGSRLGMPNMTMDILKRGSPLPLELSIGAPNEADAS